MSLVDKDGALAAARASEARWRKGEPRGLADGLPATIKDIIDVKGQPTRKGSLTTAATPAAHDAPAVARLQEQGAVILGKTTTPEFGWIGVCHSPLTGITRNPWNRERTTGGSSGGAAAAALLNLGVLHLGTDGAGSIRIPSAFTGVFGIKPSYGRVPAYPASPFTVLAHQGPLTRTVTDAALMLARHRRARRARHHRLEHAGARFPHRLEGRRARLARRLEPAARLRQSSSIPTWKRRRPRPRRSLPISAPWSKKSIPASPSRSISS